MEGCSDELSTFSPKELGGRWRILLHIRRQSLEGDDEVH
jgi:hypothetical protein